MKLHTLYLVECNVCIASLTVGKGHRFSWSSCPEPVLYPGSDTKQAPTVDIRSKGETEFGPAKFQLKRPHEEWGNVWIESTDLAGSLGWLGLEHKWDENDTTYDSFPPIFKKWLIMQDGVTIEDVKAWSEAKDLELKKKREKE